MSNNVKRNGPCPCGSGKKTKKCCLRKINAFKTRVFDGERPQSIIVEQMLGRLPKEENEA
jgi:hypothetical protein